MDIHPPHHAPLTLKEALIHLLLITAGILIALSCEGVLEWRHHREVVALTRQNLLSEIRGNQRGIRISLKFLPAAEAHFARAIELVNALSAPANRSEAAVLFGDGKDDLIHSVAFAFFNTATFSTAQSSGAFALMDYNEVVKYADIYDLQAIYLRNQDRAEQDVWAAGMIGKSVLGKPTPTEIEDVKRQLRIAMGRILAMENVAKPLDARYSAILSAERP